MPDSGQFFEFAMAYLLRRPWASEAIEAASHKVVAATALWQEGLRTNFYQRIMATEQSEKTEENKVVCIERTK